METGSFQVDQGAAGFECWWPHIIGASDPDRSSDGVYRTRRDNGPRPSHEVTVVWSPTTS